MNEITGAATNMVANVNLTVFLTYVGAFVLGVAARPYLAAFWAKLKPMAEEEYAQEAAKLQARLDWIKAQAGNAAYDFKSQK